MNAKHTQGPWNYPQHPKGVSTLIYAELGGNPEAFPVASATYGVPDEERKANARLIAAAPELLSALQACLDNGSMTGSEWVEEKARAAIAKATGEQQ